MQYGFLNSFYNGSVPWQPSPGSPLPTTIDANDMGNILSQIISSFPSGFGSGQVIPVAKTAFLS